MRGEALTSFAVGLDPLCAKPLQILEAWSSFANNTGDLCYPCLPSLLAYIYKSKNKEEKGYRV
jgi:hypothetical protein